MWKKSKLGSKIISFCVLFLVLVVFSLPAIPSWITGSAGAEQILQLKQDIAEKESTVISMTLSVQELTNQLAELQKTSENWTSTNKQLENFTDNLRSQLKSLQENLNLRNQENLKLKDAYAELQVQLSELVEASTGSENSDETLKTLVTQLQAQLAEANDNLNLALIETESLTLNLSQLETLSGLSKESFQSLMDEYLPLKDAYDIVVQERDKYYQEAVQAKADQLPGLSGMIGSDVILFANGDYGAGVSIGLGWGGIMLKLGADLKLGVPFDFDDLTYRAGINYSF